ncbi:MAG: AIPR protein [Rhodobacteraceae bacterium GWE1_64_9]|nr:MAG: AIPR protein [Rhodobacteraceae bacterium GWE1_64_9]OHC49961.1 MAG: AIPR protein [Rhodobacteraceae bacterium GWF1_65_7]HBU14816.1 AIPR protein [Gemmobacter sp.]
MSLEEFHHGFRALVQNTISERVQANDGPFPSEELVFAELVMEHVANAGICEAATICHWSGTVQGRIRITGYALSSDETRLDLFVTHYLGTDEITPIADSIIGNVASEGVRFLFHASTGKLLGKVEPSHDVHGLISTVANLWPDLDQLRVFVITDGKTKSKHFSTKEVHGRIVAIEAMDIERLYRHTAGKPREEVAISFEQTIGHPLPCVHVPDPDADYEYALAAVPGPVVRGLYERFGSRLLEANVRTFLGARGKVNKGIAETLAREPEHFMAFNNGLVLVCDQAVFGRCSDGSIGISLLKGLQIVNGGQTTSSIYFAARENRMLDLGNVMVPAKIIILKGSEESGRERLIANISKFANSQNAVKTSDLSANRPFHVQLEKLANETWCPDGVGRWFYERASGAYQVMMLREGITTAQKKKIAEAIPTKRKLSKNDIAKYHEAWRCKPAQVALAGEKNFAAFMSALDEDPSIVPDPLDAAWYRNMIAKIIIFKTVETLIKTKEAKAVFRQGYANIATYVISIVAQRLGDRIDFEQIWKNQRVSTEFQKLLYSWAVEVNDIFDQVAPGRQISEVAKRPDIWPKVRGGAYPAPPPDVPELG